MPQSLLVFAVSAFYVYMHIFEIKNYEKKIDIKKIDFMVQKPLTHLAMVLHFYDMQII